MDKSILAMMVLSAALAGGVTGVKADETNKTSTDAAPSPLYVVKDGNKVDSKTLEGWKTWRALACERCHGSEQEGLVGPSLIVSLKTLSKADFHTTVMKGRVPKGMPNFDGSAMVQKNWEGLYAYLKGRSDGKIRPGHLYPLDTK